MKQRTLATAGFGLITITHTQTGVVHKQRATKSDQVQPLGRQHDYSAQRGRDDQGSQRAA